MTISLYTSSRTSVKSSSEDPFKENLLVKSIELAMLEDLGAGTVDLTTKAIVDAGQKVEAVVYCKQANVCVAGLAVIGKVFNYIDQNLSIEALVLDGAFIAQTLKAVARISGNAAAILGAERTALNLLQRMSGIATLTKTFIARAKPFGIDILDTRKTTPGLRVFEKYAVLIAGGVNHRFGLYDQVLVKDNHIQIAKSVSNAVKACQQAYPNLEIEVECTTLDQVKECLANKVPKIMLDNMTPDMVREAVTLIGTSARIEVSGGISLANLDDYLLTGINAISIGALTHSAKNVDFSLEVEKYL